MSRYSRQEQEPLLRRSFSLFSALLAFDTPRTALPVRLAFFTANGLLFGITRAEYRGICGDWCHYVIFSLLNFPAIRDRVLELNREDCRSMDKEYVPTTTWIRHAPTMRRKFSRAGRPFAVPFPPPPLLQMVPYALFESAVDIGDQSHLAVQASKVAALTNPEPDDQLAAATFAVFLRELIKCQAPSPDALEIAISQALCSAYCALTEESPDTDFSKPFTRLRTHLADLRAPVSPDDGTTSILLTLIRLLLQAPRNISDVRSLASEWTAAPDFMAALLGTTQAMLSPNDFQIPEDLMNRHPLAPTAKILAEDLIGGWFVCNSYTTHPSAEQRRWDNAYIYGRNRL